jgi:predicted metal-dependent peptidase
MKNSNKPHKDSPEDLFKAGVNMVKSQTILSALYDKAGVHLDERFGGAKDGLCTVDSIGTVHCNKHIKAEPVKWARAIGHCLLHLGLGHFQQKSRFRDWNDACDCAVERFLSELKFAKPIDEFRDIPSVPDEDKLYERMEYMNAGERGKYMNFGVAGTGAGDMLIVPENTNRYRQNVDWQAVFAAGLINAVRSAVATASGETDGGRRTSRYEREREWFIDSYPLLGAVAAMFKIIDDPTICIREQISIAAVRPVIAEIYMNPAAHLTAEEVKFVMAHEFLHAALKHGERIEWRDPYLWNVACDFVINHWLTEMGVGERPEGLLFDEQFNGLNAESVYDIIAKDLRIYRKLATLRGIGLGDILGEPSDSKPDTDLDEFYRRALSQGLSYHEEQGRGYLPSGLVEEIRALSVPPIPWDVELARWFDEYFSPLESRRTYARPSRRQSATPDIPRPNWIVSETSLDGRTFGVVLDTSGSMDRYLLASSLGAIASYAASRDVPAARVVFCDAAAYDMGYMRPEDVAGTVKVRGRGGTVLQPGVDLLDAAEDFPKAAPMLIITDGYCDDRLVLRGREHAFLIPKGARLPFVPKGKVFMMTR